MAVYKDGNLKSSISALADIVIRHGLPIPPARAQANEAVYEAAKKMLVGDSIDLPYTRTPISANLSRTTGFKFTQRKVDDFLRIWRVE